MKLDILKASLLAMVFVFGCNTVVLASSGGSEESDSDSGAKPKTRLSRSDSIEGIEDRTGASQKYAAACVEQFNSCEEGQKLAALKSLYKMLSMKCEDSKLAAGQALLQIISTMNCQPKPCDPCKEPVKPSKTLIKAFTLTTQVELDSCKIARLVERFSRSYNNHLLNRAKASISSTRDQKIDPEALHALQRQMNSYSELSYFVNLIGQSGLQLAFAGSGTFDVMFDPCSNPCAGLCPESTKPCKPCSENKPCDDRPIDKGTQQAIDRIIKAFSCSEITDCVATLLSQVSKFGTEEQKKTIITLLSGDKSSSSEATEQQRVRRKNK